jgi:1,4-dihydroxy-2-naphthoate octaprenyltransferase
VLLGRRGARIEFLILVAVAYLVPLVLLFWFDQAGWILLPWLTLPLAVGLLRAVFTVLGPALNKSLAGTARLAALFAALLALGIILS